MGHYKATKVLKNGTAQTVGASETDQVISGVFPFTEGGATRAVRVDIHVSAVTAAAGISFQLQHSVDDTSANFGNPDTTQCKVASVNGTGWWSIILQADNSSDSAVMPLRPMGRVVCSTGAGDSVTVDDIRVSQAD